MARTENLLPSPAQSFATWHAGAPDSIRVSSLPSSGLTALNLDWGACSAADGLCHILVQGGNAWSLQSGPPQATRLADQLAALDADTARNLLSNTSKVLLWSRTQGYVIFKQPCSRTHPQWAELKAAPHLVARDTPVRPLPATMGLLCLKHSHWYAAAVTSPLAHMALPLLMR